MGSGPILSPLATTVAPLVARTLTTVEPPRKTPSAHEGSQRNGFASLQTTITNGDLVLLLVERLEKKDEGNTHYLLCVGYQVLLGGRGGVGGRGQDRGESGSELEVAPVALAMAARAGGAPAVRTASASSALVVGVVGALVVAVEAIATTVVGTLAQEGLARGSGVDGEVGGVWQLRATHH